MSEDHKFTGNHSRRPTDVGRRRFLATAGAATALRLDVLDFASSLFAAEPKREGPLVSVGFALRPSGAGMTWPSGDAKMLQQIRKHYDKLLLDAANELGVRLDIMPEPLNEDGSNYLERIEKTSPDGQIIMALNLTWEARVSAVLKNRGTIPTVVYCNLSTHNISWMKNTADLPGVCLGATPDMAWLKYALRMHKTLWRQKRMKLLENLPHEGYEKEFEKTADSDEMRAVFDFYTKNAEKIVEPPNESIIKSVRHYMTIRRLIRDGGYDGVTLRASSELCLNGGWGCLTLSRLLDEGFVAACEGDRGCAHCQFLTLSLFDLPGFMGNPTPDTVNNFAIHSHCTSATKLEGLHHDYRAPFVLRDLYNTGSGVAMMVEWPKGKRATLMDNPNGDGSFVIGAGVVTRNTKDVPQPPCGGCRTSVAFALDNVDDAQMAAFGHHKWCVMADIVRPFLAYAKLAGLEVSDLVGNKLAMSSRFGHRDWDDGVVIV